MLRVVHVNDVAGVGSALVSTAQDRGLDWSLWSLPDVSRAQLIGSVRRRVGDVAKFARDGRSFDVTHVHYGLFGYYAWASRRPYVLHLHGSDVNVNLLDRRRRPLVLRAIREARHVLYSTPDLAARVQELRPDAEWFPAPLAPGLRSAPPASVSGGRPLVVFASRWDEVKGLEELLDTVERIARERPDARLVGVDWGSGSRRAAAAGVDLKSRMSGEAFRVLLGQADVVVGQLRSGSLGVADLEAMALGRPLVARFGHSDAYGGPPPISNADGDDPVALALALLADPEKALASGRAAREWALQHHSVDALLPRLEALYQRVAGR